METPPIIEHRSRGPAAGMRVPALLAASLATVAIAGLLPLERSYSLWNGNIADAVGLVRWLLSAWTEPEFYTSALAGAGLLAGALIGECAARARSRLQGFGLACGSGLWPWTMASSVLGLVLSNLAWGWTLSATGVWQPTFVAVVSIAPTVVMVYGPGWRPALTAALSALIVTPLSIGATHFLCRPLGLPLVVGVTGGMAVGAFVSFAVCRLLPWLPVTAAEPDGGLAVQAEHRTLTWASRRILADFSEAQFFGNEWASAGLLLGAALAAIVAPAVPVYGSGQFLAVLAAQAIAAVAGMAIWHHQWVRRPFFPTFVPIVSVAPTAVLVFNGTLISVVGGGFLGALIGPPLAAAISTCLPRGFHPFIGNVAAMAISTAMIVPVLRIFHAAP